MGPGGGGVSGGRVPLPRLRTVLDRPPGVFWAATGPAGGGWLCGDPAHRVYVTRRAAPRPGRDGAPDVVRLVKVYGCAVCWPQGRGGA